MFQDTAALNDGIYNLCLKDMAIAVLYGHVIKIWELGNMSAFITAGAF